MLQILESIKTQCFKYLENRNSDFCSKDFKNAEDYYYFKVNKEINDRTLFKMLNAV